MDTDRTTTTRCPKCDMAGRACDQPWHSHRYVAEERTDEDVFPSRRMVLFVVLGIVLWALIIGGGLMLLLWHHLG